VGGGGGGGVARKFTVYIYVVVYSVQRKFSHDASPPTKKGGKNKT
jgi:hypothetical protein